MKCFSSKLNYNPVTLNPTNEEERTLFFEFRCEDVLEMYDAICIIMIVVALLSILGFLQNFEDTLMLLRLIFSSIDVIFYLIVWFGIRRFKKFNIYWLPLLFICTRVIRFIGHNIAANSKGDD